jgi:hypothetical protein
MLLTSMSSGSDTISPRPEELARASVSKDDAKDAEASWFETAHTRLLTMRI